MSWSQRGVDDGLKEIDRFLEQWQRDARDLRRRMILAPTPRKRERWYALWLLAQGWTASAVAEALDRDPHTIGRCDGVFGQGGRRALILEQSGGRSLRGSASGVKGSGPRVSCSSWNRFGQLELESDASFVQERFSISLCRSRCLNYLHWLGFAFKRPKKRLRNADEARREAFVAEYAALRDEVGRTGGKIFFADEAHFQRTPNCVASGR